MSAKTPFAGLMVLEPGEPLSTENYRFTSVDPILVDHLLKVGAVLHRHDEHTAL
ncbi:MAG: hypothetical protein QOJ29_888, partial [Thermoleophilaceae bacterium]|nr:hypothetical protein [Thermoleophilaceae bacterium]